MQSKCVDSDFCQLNYFIVFGDSHCTEIIKEQKLYAQAYIVLWKYWQTELNVGIETVFYDAQ